MKATVSNKPVAAEMEARMKGLMTLSSLYRIGHEEMRALILEVSMLGAREFGCC
jgi:hypothetical protein